MIIEFTGVPCSGKSDVSHELAKILREQGFSVCEKQYELSHSGNSKNRIITKIASCFLYGLKHPKKTIDYYFSIGSVRLWMNYIYLLSHNCKSKICILEQGYLQFIGSFFDNIEINAQEADLLFKKLMPQADVIQVFVSASKETVLNRAKSREDKPFFMQTEAPEAALDYAFIASETLNKIWCKNKGDTKFISISNEENNAQHTVAKNVFEKLKQRELL